LFFQSRGYLESLESVWFLLYAFERDFSFDFRYTFGWPTLPKFALLQFALSVGVLAFQLIMTNFYPIYYGMGVYQSGNAVIDKALKKKGYDDDDDDSV